jgi:hypothetical protein
VELQEFVKAALLQITAAVREAQDVVRSSGGFVNPSVVSSTPGNADLTHFATLESGQNVFLIDFDVAVTATDAIEGGGGAKLSVASVFSIHGGAKTTTTSESTSRIRFKVPLALPVDSRSKTEFDRRLREQDEAVSRFNHGLGA